MAGTENMRWPQPRSPEQLRAFYSIALQSDDNDSKVSAEYHESRSVASSTWSSSGSVRAHASRSTSIFSGQARTGSSATSVSDSRTIVALAPKTTYEDTTGLLRLHEWQCSHAPNFESDANETSFVAEGIDTDVSYQSEKNEDEPVGYKWRGGRSLPRLHRCQVQDETSKHDAGSDPVIPVSTQPEPAEKFWLDTLQEHPYCNLDTKRKLGRVGMWAVKRRRRDLKLGISSTKGKADVESDTKLAKDKLLEDSNSSLDSDDETVHIVDDVVEEVASLMGSSNSRLRRSYSRLSKPGSADRTLLLNLGVDPSLRSSFDSAYVDNPSILSSSTSIGTLELSTCADLRDMEEDGLATHAPRVTGNHQHVNSTLYCCLFCLKVFGSQEVWEEHERSQHVAMQKDWICMPWGPIERNEDGHEVCVFCGLVDPDSSHCSEHNDEPCCHTSVSRRTFDCKADFQEHLEDVHDQFIISDCMRKWSFAAEDIDWYWQCGFCDRSLVGWEDRSRHIGRHFKEGLSMGSWDPVVPSCPVDRGTGIVVSWSPPIQMDRRTLLTVQSESISSLTLGDGSTCKYCTAKFLDEEDMVRHEKLWHLPRDSWRCPTKNDIRTATHLQNGPLAAFLFPNATPSSLSTEDVCPYCCEYSEDIFYDLDEDIDECVADWQVRIEHLQSEHGFDDCPNDLVFYRPDQFLLHLVGCHNINLSKWTKGIMISCKRGSSASAAKEISHDSNGV